MLQRLFVLFLVFAMPLSAAAAPSQVRIVQQDGAYVMLVDGQPFHVKGAGMGGDGQELSLMHI